MAAKLNNLLFKTSNFIGSKIVQFYSIRFPDLHRCYFTCKEITCIGRLSVQTIRIILVQASKNKPEFIWMYASEKANYEMQCLTQSLYYMYLNQYYMYLNHTHTVQYLKDHIKSFCSFSVSVDTCIPISDWKYIFILPNFSKSVKRTVKKITPYTRITKWQSFKIEMYNLCQKKSAFLQFETKGGIGRRG